MKLTKVLKCGEVLCVPMIDTQILLHRSKRERDVSEAQQVEEHGIPGDLRLVRAYAQMRTECQE